MDAFVQSWKKWKATEDTPGLKSLKYFLAGLSWKKFADSWDSRKIYEEERTIGKENKLFITG